MTTDLRQDRTYTIRQLCEEFGCTARALRFYEDKGLLEPRRAGLNRIYSRKDRARLQLILRGKNVGLSLAEIGELMDLHSVADGGEQQAASSLLKLREKLAEFEHQRTELDHTIAVLRDGIARLERRVSGSRPELLAGAGDQDSARGRELDRAPHR